MVFTKMAIELELQYSRWFANLSTYYLDKRPPHVATNVWPRIINDVKTNYNAIFITNNGTILSDITDLYVSYPVSVRFESENDRTMFLLRWG